MPLPIAAASVTDFWPLLLLLLLLLWKQVGAAVPGWMDRI
jgi:hypothetical protein